MAFEPCGNPTCPFTGPHIHVTGDAYTVVGFTIKPDDDTTTTSSSGSPKRTTVRWASSSNRPRADPEPLDELLAAAGVHEPNPDAAAEIAAKARYADETNRAQGQAHLVNDYKRRLMKGHP